LLFWRSGQLRGGQGQLMTVIRLFVCDLTRPPDLLCSNTIGRLCMATALPAVYRVWQKQAYFCFPALSLVKNTGKIKPNLATSDRMLFSTQNHNLVEPILKNKVAPSSARQ